MKTKLFLKYWAMIYGIIITALLLLIIGTKIAGKVFEEGPSFLANMVKGFADWSDPGPFFMVYIAGYAISWWKPLWGSLIIMAGSIYFVAANTLDWGPVIFAGPAFFVGFFYLLAWIFARDINIFKS